MPPVRGKEMLHVCALQCLGLVCRTAKFGSHFIRIVCDCNVQSCPDGNMLQSFHSRIAWFWGTVQVIVAFQRFTFIACRALHFQKTRTQLCATTMRDECKSWRFEALFWEIKLWQTKESFGRQQRASVQHCHGIQSHCFDRQFGSAEYIVAGVKAPKNPLFLSIAPLKPEWRGVNVYTWYQIWRDSVDQQIITHES